MMRSNASSPIRRLAFSTSRNAHSRSTPLLSGPHAGAVCRRRGAGGPPRGGGILAQVRDTLGVGAGGEFLPQKMGPGGPLSLPG